MSKIQERREKTANTEYENKAVMAEGNENGGANMVFKRVLMVAIMIVIVGALVLLVLNSIVDSYAAKFNDAGVDINIAASDSKLETINRNEPLYNGAIEQAIKDGTINKDINAMYTAALTNYANASTDIKAKAGVYNFVIIATNAEEEDIETGLILLASIDTTTEKVTYAIIEKTNLVVIPTVGVGPLYDAYAWGGAALLARTVQENYGVAVNGFVETGFEGFKKAVDNYGKVKIDGKEYTGETLYTFVLESEDRAVAMTKIVKALMPKIVESGMGGAKDTLDTITDDMSASVSRDDFGTLYDLGVSVFENTADAIYVGTSTDAVASYMGGAGVFARTCDYAAERAILLKALGLDK
ncbi:MAG: LCP family protein [Clostridia bacterium]|nr:LCP family protein [Clostridia bacterium]